MNIRVDGIDEIMKSLSKLENKTNALAKSTLYEGAKVIADDAQKALQAIPVMGDKLPYISPAMAEKRGTRLTGVTTQQKADIIKGLGISRMRTEGGEVNVRIGFSGYTVDGTGKGRKPVALLVRAMESGTSFSKKTPIVRKAYANAKPKATEAMQKHLDKVIRESFD